MQTRAMGPGSHVIQSTVSTGDVPDTGTRTCAVVTHTHDLESPF